MKYYLINKSMKKQEIIYWKNRYDKEEDLYNKGLEEYLNKKFNKNGYIKKIDLVNIVKWKFQGRLIGRQRRILKYIEKNCESYIKKRSKEAFSIVEDKKKLSLLSSPNILGVGNALSSVILSFFDPKNYGILDIHAWRELFGKEPSNIFSSRSQAQVFFNRLRKISKETNLFCREIEKALFKKNLEESKK